MGLSIDQHSRLFAESTELDPAAMAAARQWLARYAERNGLSNAEVRRFELMLGIA